MLKIEKYDPADPAATWLKPLKYVLIDIVSCGENEKGQKVWPSPGT